MAQNRVGVTDAKMPQMHAYIFLRNGQAGNLVLVVKH